MCTAKLVPSCVAWQRSPSPISLPLLGSLSPLLLAPPLGSPSPAISTAPCCRPCQGSAPPRRLLHLAPIFGPSRRQRRRAKPFTGRCSPPLKFIINSCRSCTFGPTTISRRTALSCCSTMTRSSQPVTSRTSCCLSYQPLSSFPLPPNTSPPPNRYGESSTVFYPKSESSWARPGPRLLMLRHLTVGRPESTGEPPAPMGNSFPLFWSPVAQKA
jgi:hypothetical protein